MEKRETMMKPYKGYENHLTSCLAKKESEEELKAVQAQGKELMSYTLPEDMTMTIMSSFMKKILDFKIKIKG